MKFTLIRLFAAALFSLGLIGVANAATAPSAAPAMSAVTASQTLITDGIVEPVQYGYRRRGGRCRRVCVRRRGRVDCQVRGCRRWDRRGPRPRGCISIGPVVYCP